MAVDPSVQWSPAWWAAQLTQRLDARITGDAWWQRDARPRERERNRPKPGIRLLDDYLNGDPPIGRATDAWRDGMRGFLRMSRMNYADLCISSVSERMDLQGFQTAADNDESGDARAEDIARENELRSWLPDLWDDMLGLGWAYASVQAGPVVALESPFECYQASDSTGRRPIAQVKRTRDEWTGNTLTVVWSLGDPSDPGKLTMHQILEGPGGQDWGRGGDEGELVDGFPLVQFQNRRSQGDFETHMDVLDRINDTIFERVVISKYQAFRQRVAMNTPDKDDDGNDIDYSTVLTTDPGAWMRLPEGATMWESGTVDLGPIREAIKDDVMSFAAVTKSPMNYLMPDAANGTAEGASAMREAFSRRVSDRQRRADRPLARLMAAAFRLAGDTERADALAIKPLWEPLDSPSMNDRASAFAQFRAQGWPFGDAAVRFGGVAPSDLSGLQDSRSDDLLFDQAQAEALTPEPVPEPSDAAVA